MFILLLLETLTLIRSSIVSYFSHHKKYASIIFDAFSETIVPINFQGQDEFENDVICFIANEKHSVLGNLNLSLTAVVSSRTKKADMPPLEESTIERSYLITPTMNIGLSLSHPASYRYEMMSDVVPYQALPSKLMHSTTTALPDYSSTSPRCKNRQCKSNNATADCILDSPFSWSSPLLKGGDFREKGEIVKQGQRNDLKTATSLIRGGTDMRTVADQCPETFVRYGRGLRDLALILSTPYEHTECRGYWYVGKPGTGKSRTAREFPDVSIIETTPNSPTNEVVDSNKIALVQHQQVLSVLFIALFPLHIVFYVYDDS